MCLASTTNKSADGRHTDDAATLRGLLFHLASRCLDGEEGSFEIDGYCRLEESRAQTTDSWSDNITAFA